MENEQFRVLVKKLEEIRCCIIDVENAISERNKEESITESLVMTPHWMLGGGDIPGQIVVTSPRAILAVYQPPGWTGCYKVILADNSVHEIVDQYGKVKEYISKK